MTVMLKHLVTTPAVKQAAVKRKGNKKSDINIMLKIIQSTALNCTEETSQLRNRTCDPLVVC